MFTRGFLLGISIAAPVGPIGLLCIRTSLAQGRLAGFMSGLGAAFADLVYGVLAVTGIAAATAFLDGAGSVLRYGGCALLVYLGLRLLLRQRAQSQAASAGGFFSTFLLTISNPMTIVSFAAMFSALGLPAGADITDRAALVFGVFIGSASWWLILAGTAGSFRSRMTVNRLAWLDRGAGVVIAGLGITTLFIH